MELSRNLSTLRLSGIRRYTALATQVGGCVMLTLGEPEFDTPRPIVEAAKAALDSGFTHYTENRGYPSLRKAIAAFEEENRGLTYTEDEIIITAGATEAIFIAMMGVLNPGDEVIIPVPAFSLYGTIAKLLGAVPVELDTSSMGFQLTADALAQAITPRTKLLVLNSPNNPTGVIYTEENLRRIGSTIQGKDIIVLSDDVYWGLSPCFTFSQLTGLRPQILSVQSFSKPYAMTGWRTGYLMAPLEVAQKLTALHGHCVSCVPAMLQQACLTALTVDPMPMAQCYTQRRDYLCARLEQMGLPHIRPQGAFYVFPDIRHLNMTSDTFCTRLIREGRVATVPGSVFGAEGFFRMSYCCAMDALKTGLDRLESFIHTL